MLSFTNMAQPLSGLRFLLEFEVLSSSRSFVFRQGFRLSPGISPFTRGFVFRQGFVSSQEGSAFRNLHKMVSPNNYRQYHSTGVCYAQKTKRLIAKPGKKNIEPKPVAFEEDTLDLENADLFPIIETQSVSQPIVTNQSPGITQAFHDLYTYINQHTQLSTPSHELPRHTRLNNLIYQTTTRAEAELLCELVAQWRRKLLPITLTISRFLIKKLCEVDAHHLAFNMLADRSKYALKPNIEMFRWIMLAYANEVTKLFEDTTRIIKSEDKNEDKSENKSEDKSDVELVLDDLYKTFGLMPYYDVPQFDVHLYTIMLSSSIKLESWQLVDEVVKELIDHLDESHNRGKEIFGVYSDAEKYSDEIRISWLTSSLDVFIRLEKWYEENKNLIYVEKFKNLQEQWKNEIKKVQSQGASF